MKLTPQQLGEAIHAARKNLGVTQKALALTSGTGLRFIIDLEKGKPTCQIGKALTVLNTLGASVKVIPPPSAMPRIGTKPLVSFSKVVIPRDTSKRLEGQSGGGTKNRKPDRA